MARKQTVHVDIGEREIELRVRRNLRARSMIIAVDDRCGGVSLILPRGVSVAEGRRFAEDKRVWLQNQLEALPLRVPFTHGTVLPILGVDHRVRHRPDARGAVWREDDEIHVAGQAEHVSRRLGDWLREEARAELARRARDKATGIGRKIGRITVRDTRSRWGSCSVDGNLSFCWRLIFAPEPVFDYVVAHEVAHLAEMNHSPAFWKVVARITADVKTGRDWLRRHGSRLHRYG